VTRFALAGVALAALALPSAAFAHGIGTVRDLPVPMWLFYYGAGAVLVASFVALGALWSQPVLEDAARGRPLPAAIQRVVLSPVVSIATRGFALFVFLVVWAAAAFGTTSQFDNLAPTFIYVVFWLGVPALVVLLGNVWTVLNPWRAAADLAAWLSRALGREWRTPFEYPPRLGYWPAAVLLASFTALELAYSDPASPRALAVAIGLYSYVNWMGMAAFGREAWTRNGDGFSVYFHLLSRLSPFAVHQENGSRKPIVRAPLSGLAELRPQAGALAIVSVMLGSVAFDGFSRSLVWQKRLFAAQSRFVEDPRLADLVGELMNVAGLIAFVIGVALTFTLALRAARVLGDSDADLGPTVVWSLVPIAFAYVVAHYFSLFLINGQYAITLISDPFGRGWDLFSTKGFRPNLGFLSPNTTWYVQVGALVVGHVAGLAVAHDRALAVLGTTRAALRSQYAILALMVLYTVGGLWLLSRG
jgi:hypothetical protein